MRPDPGDLDGDESPESPEPPEPPPSHSSLPSSIASRQRHRLPYSHFAHQSSVAKGIINTPSTNSTTSSYPQSSGSAPISSSASTTDQQTSQTDSPKHNLDHVVLRGDLAGSIPQDSGRISRGGITSSDKQKHQENSQSPAMLLSEPLVQHGHPALLHSIPAGGHYFPRPTASGRQFVPRDATSGSMSLDFSSDVMEPALAAQNMNNLLIDIPDRTRVYDDAIKYSLNQDFRHPSGDEYPNVNTQFWGFDAQGSSSAPSASDRVQSDHHLHTTTFPDNLTIRPTIGDAFKAPNAQISRPITEGSFDTSSRPLSPASYPTSDTVNPMDIMPASTDKEVWYRNEHQIYIPWPNQPNSDAPAFPFPFQMEEASMSDFGGQPTQTAESLTQPAEVAEEASYVVADCLTMEEDAERNDVVMPNILPMSRLNSGHAYVHGRRHSLPSDHLGGFGVASSEPSSHNSPSTILDSPSPESGDSSDFRYSASPQLGQSMPSPRGALFRCDEAGCNQVFDQPHKLKHHQRYHSKNHKCTYPGCGKGFGTKTHLQRHINDRHEKKKKYHCAIQGCDYSKAGGKAFPRKDNWKRHMTKIHNMDPSHLPEPMEVDP